MCENAQMIDGQGTFGDTALKLNGLCSGQKRRSPVAGPSAAAAVKLLLEWNNGKMQFN